MDVLHWHTDIKNIGFDITKNELDVLYSEFLKVADSKKEVNDEDLNVIMNVYSQSANYERR